MTTNLSASRSIADSVSDLRSVPTLDATSSPCTPLVPSTIFRESNQPVVRLTRLQLCTAMTVLFMHQRAPTKRLLFGLTAGVSLWWAIEDKAFAERVLVMKILLLLSRKYTN